MSFAANLEGELTEREVKYRMIPSYDLGSGIYSSGFNRKQEGFDDIIRPERPIHSSPSDVAIVTSPCTSVDFFFKVGDEITKPEEIKISVQRREPNVLHISSQDFKTFQQKNAGLLHELKNKGYFFKT